MALRRGEAVTQGVITSRLSLDLAAVDRAGGHTLPEGGLVDPARAQDVVEVVRRDRVRLQQNRVQAVAARGLELRGARDGVDLRATAELGSDFTGRLAEKPCVL